MDIIDNKQTLERFDRLVEACDAEGLDEICTPDMTNHALASHRAQGSRQPSSSCANAAKTRARSRGCEPCMASET